MLWKGPHIDCENRVHCSGCGSSFHPSPLHVNREKPISITGLHPYHTNAGRTVSLALYKDTNVKHINCGCSQLCVKGFNGNYVQKQLLYVYILNSMLF